MHQHFLWLRILRQWKATSTLGFPEKPRHAFRIQIGHDGAATGRGVKWTFADEFALKKVAHQRSIDAGDQLGHRDKPAADQFIACLPDERAHLGMLGRIFGAFDKDQPLFAKPGGMGELAVRRRYTLRILKTVFVAEEAT